MRILRVVVGDRLEDRRRLFSCVQFIVHPGKNRIKSKDGGDGRSGSVNNSSGPAKTGAVGGKGEGGRGKGGGVLRRFIGRLIYSISFHSIEMTKPGNRYESHHDD